MCARLDTKMREAAKKTIVPLINFVVLVWKVESNNAMAATATALPNLQMITLYSLGHGHKWSEGEDPDEEEAARTANWTAHDIGILSNFRRLRSLEIGDALFKPCLNGIYPVLFNFPLLQKLSGIWRC